MKLLADENFPLPSVRILSSSLEEPAEYLLALLERSELSLLGMFTVAERDRVRQRLLPGTR